MFEQLLAVMAPVLVSVAIGYGWVRSGQQFPTNFVSTLCLNIGTPCLILSSLAQTHLSIQLFMKMAIGTFGTILALGIIGIAFCKVKRIDWRSFVPALMFPNTGNMGLPISLFAFGQAGFGYAVAINVAVSIVQFGLSAMMDAERPLMALLKTPTIHAVWISLVFMFFQIPLPTWIENSTHLLGDMTIPLMLITLGVALASIKPNNLLAGAVFGLLRLAMVIPISLGVGWLAGLSGTLSSQLMLQMSMPVAVYTYMFAQKAKRSPELAASRVFISTVMSLVYLPIMLAIIMSLLPSAGVGH
ncbi:AEC family transporter [Carnimonas bestiolae]|uniref:AEC family transporter n=1 Tax=Carnimonas bestiolae TaxID=3402172 RepID=UPI003EDC4755